MTRSLLRFPVSLMVAALFAATPAAAQPYFEQTGPPAATGAVIVLHGGGWQWTGPQMVAATRVFASRFEDRYRTFNADYRPGALAVPDVLETYDSVRAQVGPDMPICVVGGSAGGHLALELAAQRDVACAVSDGGPTDITVATGELLRLVQQAFGYDAAVYAERSPALHADRITAPVLLAHEEMDHVVPIAQAREFADREPGTQLVVLPDGPGGVNFIHRQVDPAALQAYFATERAFMTEAMRRWTAVREAAPAVAPTGEQPVAAHGTHTSPRRHRSHRAHAKHAARHDRRTTKSPRR